MSNVKNISKPNLERFGVGIVGNLRDYIDDSLDALDATDISAADTLTMDNGALKLKSGNELLSSVSLNLADLSLNSVLTDNEIAAIMSGASSYNRSNDSDT